MSSEVIKFDKKAIKALIALADKIEEREKAAEKAIKAAKEQNSTKQ